MNLIVPKGATKPRKRLGRGTSSGLGKTAGRGMKGQKARNTTRAGFEGGQMPLYRRIARRGFSNAPFKKQIFFVSLTDLSRCFNEGDEVSLATLQQKRLVKKVATRAKILSDGEIDKSLTVVGLSMSKVAREKLVAANCKIVEIQPISNNDEKSNPSDAEKNNESGDVNS